MNSDHTGVIPATRRDQLQRVSETRLSDLPKEIRDAQRKLEQQRRDLDIAPTGLQTAISLDPSSAPGTQPLLHPRVNIEASPPKRSTADVAVTARNAEKVVLIREMESQKRLDLGCLAR